MKNHNVSEWDREWAKQSETLIVENIRYPVFYLMDEVQFEYLQPLLPAQGRTLEVGAGSGRMSVFLSSRANLETVLVDCSAEALRVAQNNYRLAKQKGEFILGEAHRLPFEDDSFDVILSLGLLEHFEDAQPPVDEMVRVLKRGGLFYAAIAPRKFRTLTCLDFLIKLDFLTDKSDRHFEQRLSKDEIHQMLKRAGLEGIDVFPAGVFPPRVPLLPWSKTYRRLETKALYSLKGFWKRLDRTALAERLGFYYFAYGYKPED